MIYQKHIKRILDLSLSTAGLIVLSPIFGILVIAIKTDTKGPILFKQKRVGSHKQLFNIYKFRTMRSDTPKDIPTHMLKNPDQYITKVGKFLRKTSLDELPQIFNIIKGEMSIIGSRPALWNTGLPDYATSKIPKAYQWFKRRNEVIHQVEIHRVPTFARRRGSFFRVLSYLSFALNAFFIVHSK